MSEKKDKAPDDREAVMFVKKLDANLEKVARKLQKYSEKAYKYGLNVTGGQLETLWLTICEDVWPDVCDMAKEIAKDEEERDNMFKYSSNHSSD